MKQKITLSTIALTLCLTTNSLAQTEITFASIKTFGTNTMPDLIHQFEQENPDIKINYVEMPAPSQSTEIHQYLVTNLAGGGSSIDVFTIDIIWFAEFAEAGWLLPLDDYMIDAEKSQYYPGIINGLTYKQQLVGIPWYLDSGMLYYRKDLLEKYGYQPPKTWQALIDQAKDITRKENNPDLRGFIWQGKQSEVLVCDLVEFLGEGDIIDQNLQTTINSHINAQGSQLMYDLIYTHKISPKALTTYDEEPSRRIFTEGGGLFLRNWSYVWSIAQDESQSKIAGKVGIAPLPGFEGKKGAATLGGYQFGINKNSDEKDASVKFAKFLSQPQSQLYFADKIGFAPTRPAVYPDIKDDFLRNLSDVFVGAKARPVTPFYPEVSLILQSEYSALLGDKQDVATTLKNAEKRINKVTAQ